jgi:RNA polymerase sigma-70 factor (ECF subfamily)
VDDDAPLIAAARRDPQAFVHVYDRHAPGLFRYFVSHCRDQAAAEDLVSQTFLAALAGLPRFRGDGPFVAWLYGLARRKLADHWRGRQRAHDLLAENLPDVSELPDLDQAHRIQRLKLLVSGLSADARELLRLRYVSDLRFHAIAAVIGKSEEATKKMLYRLLDHMRAELENEVREVGGDL